MDGMQNWTNYLEVMRNRLMSDDMFTTVQLNLDTVKKVDSKISVDGRGVVMKLTIRNGAEFLLMFHTDFVEEDD